MKNIYVLGSINMDLVIQTPYMPKNGETIKGQNFFMNEGGKGANQAVAASKQNINTFLIGNIGKDVFGKKSLDTLKNYQVKCAYVQETNKSTGIAMIVIENNNNRIILDTGANDEIQLQQIDNALNHVQKGDLFITQLENNFSAIEYGLKKAKEKEMITIFNPAPAKELPISIYSFVDYLILNESECEILTNICPENEKKQKEAYQFFQQNGLKKLIITLGEKGSVYFSDEETFLIKANKIEPVDTTAAGDTFVGTFAASLAQGKSEIFALNYASLCSSLTCLKKGAQQSIPTLSEVENYIKNKE